MNKPRNMKAGAFAIAMLFIVMAVATTVNATLPPHRNAGIPIVPGGEFEMTQQPAGGMSSQISDGGGGGTPSPPTEFYTCTASDSDSNMPGFTVITQNYCNDPDGQEGYFPPSDGRKSFIYMTGMYEEYNGTMKLVGVWFNIWMLFDGMGNYYHAEWEPGNVYLTLLGDHAGSYYKPDWFMHATWHGTGGWKGIALGYHWNPVNDRLTYFHLWADYKENGVHIRYPDRTFTETWGSNNG